MNLRKTITKCVGLLLDYTVVPVVKYTYLRLTACSHPRSKTVIDVLRDRAAISSADYVEGHMPYALEFPDRFKLLDYSLTKIAVSGIYAEFGVWKGQSINIPDMRAIRP